MKVIIEIIVAVTLLLSLWTFLSLKIVGPNQMGVFTVFGRTKRFVNSGLTLVPWLICRVYIFPKEILTFTFEVKTAKTKQGKVKGYNDDKELGPADVDIKCKFFSYFPRNAKLSTTLESAPGRTAQKVGPAITPYVIDIIRSVAGSLPWPIIDQERESLVDYILAKIIPGRPYREITVDNEGFFTFGQIITPTNEETKAMMRENPLVQLALDLEKSSLSIEDVNLSDPELAKRLDEQEKARLDAAAVRQRADAEKYRLTEEGAGAAAARKSMVEVIKENPDLELMLSLREMAKGSSNTIFYQIPHAFEEKLGGILGGNNSKDLLARLSQDDWKEIANKLMSLTQKK